MTTSGVDLHLPAVVGVSLTDDTLTAILSDGRTISVPLAWYPRLLHARPRNEWRLIAPGRRNPLGASSTKTSASRA